jgi:predicted TIM-barrel fold metal-dependent hydrolase
MATHPPKARHIPVREDWLALRAEEVVDPGLPIIDAHHHLWDKPGSRYLAADMRADIGGGHSVVATVYVEGKAFYRAVGEPHLMPLGETEAVAAMAEASAAGGGPLLAAGIVGYVDLMLGSAVGDVLDRHAEAAKGRFCGVRNTTAWHADPEARGSVLSPPPGMLYSPALRQGLAELARRGLVFDAWMYHTQLGELVDLAHAMPELAIVIDHAGGPIGIGPYQERHAEVFEDWRHFMGRLACHDNIAVKLGGFGMLMAGFDFQDRSLPPGSDDLAAAWAPYFDECIRLFGPQRCMFESNFPVDKGTASYIVLWNAFKKIAAGLSDQERHRLFFGTADEVYGLGIRLPDAARAPAARG